MTTVTTPHGSIATTVVFQVDSSTVNPIMSHKDTATFYSSPRLVYLSKYLLNRLSIKFGLGTKTVFVFTNGVSTRLGLILGAELSRAGDG